MHTITNNTLRALGIASAMLVLAMVPFVQKAHAADLPLDSGYSTDWFDTQSFDTAMPSYGSYDSGTYNTPWYDTTSYDTASPSYDYGSSMDYGYTPGYGGGSFFGGGFPFSGGAYGAPGNVNSNTNVNTNTNTCTTNSCNTTISTPINAPTTIVNSGNNSAPSTPVYQPVQPVYQPSYQPVYYPQQPIYQPSYPAPCTTCGCNGVYCNNQRPAPYVSLSAVPYTGLDLGPTGTVLYWGFLVLWCLGAAYLIAVKRIQNTIVAKLFGTKSKTATTAHTAHVATHAPVIAKKAESAPSLSKFGNIDPFIASQLNKLA